MPNYQRSTIHTADDIIAIAQHAGSHFFDEDTMRLFNSRVMSEARALDGVEAVEGSRFLFVTSERHGDAPRHYAVRMLILGSIRYDRPYVAIDTVGGHHSTRQAALAAMRAY